MPDPGREAMSDIISAKCFGCGHVVKVPSALGGKKARCPKCTNTIVIPALAETSDEIVTDDQLPEVARDGEVLDRDGEVLEGELVDPEPEAPSAPESPRHSRSSGAHRRVGVKESASGRSGTRMQGVRGGAPPPKPAASNTGLVIGIIVGALVIVALLVAVMKSSKNEPPKKRADAGETKPPEAARSSDDDALEARCREYLAAYSRGQIAETSLFYEPEPNRDLRQAVGRLIGDNPITSGEIKRVSAVEGVTVYVGSPVGGGAGREVTLRWRKVDREWFIAERP